MNVEVKSVHFDLYDKTREYLDKKLERLAFAKDYLVDAIFTFTKEKDFKAEATLNFKWGLNVHMAEEDFDLNVAIDKLTDKVEHKIRKEKEKVQEPRK
jgi:putative sigma-54 modulation protein